MFGSQLSCSNVWHRVKYVLKRQMENDNSQKTAEMTLMSLKVSSDPSQGLFTMDVMFLNLAWESNLT